MNANENVNTACEMPDQRPEGTRTAVVGLPGSSTGLVEEGQPPRQQEVCPSSEADKKDRTEQPKPDQAEGTTTGDDKGTLLSQPSLDPDDLRRKRGQTEDAVEDDGKIALFSQLRQPNLDPDGLGRERHQTEHTATDADALSSQPCLDSYDPSNRSAQVGDTTMDDVALASQPNLDPDDQSCQHQQAENSMTYGGKITVSSRHSLDSDDPSQESEQAWDTTTSDDNTLSGKPSLDPDDPSHQRDEDQLLDLPHCEAIVRKATSAPDSLTSVEMEELVRAICQKAAEDSENAWPAANLCLSIIAKQPKPKFIDCLLRSCKEWFEQRAERLPRTTRKGSVWWKRQQQREGAGAVAAGPSWKWTAYVAFVAELLVAVTGAKVRTPVGTRRFSTTRDRAYCLAMLLCECCQETLRWPAQDMQDMQEEMECLRAALTSAGRVADQVASDRMEIMFHWLRAACFDHQFTPDARDVAREIANLRCLGWKKPEVSSATNL